MPRRLAGRRPAPARELERALERPGSALRPGDRAPNFVRVDQRGRPFALYERRCGRPSLLLVSPVLDDTAIGVLEALRAALPAETSVGLAALRLQRVPPPAALQTIDPDALPILADDGAVTKAYTGRSEEHTSELQSLMRTSYAVFC